MSTSNDVITGASLMAMIIITVYYRINNRKQELQRIRNKRKDGTVNIGAIFGMDVGGTLTKIVYFEARPNRISSSKSFAKLNEKLAKSKKSSDVLNIAPESAKVGRSSSEPNSIPESVGLVKRNSAECLAQLDSPDHQAALEKLYNYMAESVASGVNRSIVQRDDALCAYSDFLEGQLHFLHFETRNMVGAVQLVGAYAPIEHIRSIGCTGGGAHKYAEVFQEQLGITFNKFDELQCLVRGMHFAITNFEDECYTYRSMDDPDPAEPKASSMDSEDDYELGDVSLHEKDHPKVPSSANRWQRESKDYTKRVKIPLDNHFSEFPYLLVNIGSGVSILKVTGPGQSERISGTSLGGGTYWGLCRLLTNCASFDEVLDLAEAGDAGLVDMLVKDIYGGDYGESLSGAMVASSFGKLVMKENPREGIKEEDLALALLMMITNNIGQVAYLNAQLHGCSKIFFVGNFLRRNSISCRRLSFAIDFWSKGQMDALFLVHEGHFGALGTFLSSAFGDEVDTLLSNSSSGNVDKLGVKGNKGGLSHPTGNPTSSNGEIDVIIDETDGTYEFTNAPVTISISLGESNEKIVKKTRHRSTSLTKNDFKFKSAGSHNDILGALAGGKGSSKSTDNGTIAASGRGTVKARSISLDYNSLR